jgi:hypothetical protein
MFLFNALSPSPLPQNINNPSLRMTETDLAIPNIIIPTVPTNLVRFAVDIDVVRVFNRLHC